MSIFAQIVGGIVVNVVVADAIERLDPAETWVRIDTLTPQPGIGWTYDGAFTAPHP